MVKMNCALMRATVSAGPCPPASVDRAVEVQAALAERSRPRSVPLPDLLVAACAGSAGLTVLHHDADDDRIAEVTGQPTEWMVRPGAVD
jgi:predicted nucleic acid-binding protein